MIGATKTTETARGQAADAEGSPVIGLERL